MPNCCMWWYSRRDLERGHVHWQFASVKRIAVGMDGTAEILSKDVKRTIFTNDTLKKQVARIPQVVNNGPDGKGLVVGQPAEAAAKRQRTG